jgi:hypothetical protein
VLLAAWFSASSRRTMGSGAQISASMALGSGMGRAACCLPLAEAFLLICFRANLGGHLPTQLMPILAYSVDAQYGLLS